MAAQRDKFDRERAARILVDAIELGDRKAAEKWKITDRTLRNYRYRLADDPVLSANVIRKGKAAEASWHSARANVLKLAAQRAAELIAVETNLDKVSRAVEAFGELDMAAKVLDVGDRTDSEGAAAAGDAGSAREDQEPLAH